MKSLHVRDTHVVIHVCEHMNVNVHMNAVYVCIHTVCTEYIVHCMHMSA